MPLRSPPTFRQPTDTPTDAFPSPSHAIGRRARGCRDDVTFRDCRFVIRGSACYGYGDLYGKGGGSAVRLQKHSAIHVSGDRTLIVEEKLEGTNVGIHFSDEGQLVLQCRGHQITEGMYPQYDLFKQWATVKRYVLKQRLGNRFLLFGEWVYARHSVFYRQLTHYFFEFDIYDKEIGAFLDLERRLTLLAGAGIQTVPVLHSGALKQSELEALMGPSKFDSQFENPLTHRTDNLMEGLYLRTEADGIVTGRAKFVRSEFVEKVKRSTHWQHQVMVPNQLADGVDIWS